MPELDELDRSATTAHNELVYSDQGSTKLSAFSDVLVKKLTFDVFDDLFLQYISPIGIGIIKLNDFLMFLSVHKF